MNACSTTIRMWNIAQPTPSRRAEEGADQPGRGPDPQQDEDDLASVHVAVQTQGVRKRLGNVLDQVEQEVERPQQRIRAERRAEQLVDPAAQALHRDAEVDHQQPDAQRQSKRGVDVGGRHAAPVVQMEHVLVDPGQDVHRQEIHGVHHQNPDEHGQRHRRDESVPVAVGEDALHLLVDEIERELDESLSPVGYSGRRAADDPPQEAERQHAEDRGGDQRVDVQSPEPAFAELLGIEGKVVGDVAGGGQFLLGCHRAMRDQSVLADEHGHRKDHCGN